VGEKCNWCGADVNDDTRDCPKCGHRTTEERLVNRVKMLEEANKGCRTEQMKIKAIVRNVIMELNRANATIARVGVELNMIN